MSHNGDGINVEGIRTHLYTFSLFPNKKQTRAQDAQENITRLQYINVNDVILNRQPYNKHKI